jgi:hypothetical protein
VGFLDRIFGRRGERGTGTRDDSAQPLQTPIQDSGSGQSESHHHGGHDQPGQQDPGTTPQDPGATPQDPQSDPQSGDPAGGDAGGGDTGGGGGDGGGGNGGGGGD